MCAVKEMYCNVYKYKVCESDLEFKIANAMQFSL